MFEVSVFTQPVRKSLKAVIFHIPVKSQSKKAPISPCFLLDGVTKNPGIGLLEPTLLRFGVAGKNWPKNLLSSIDCVK